MPPQAAPKAYRLTKFGGKCRARFPKSSFKKKFNIRGVKNVKISIKNILTATTIINFSLQMLKFPQKI